MSQESRDVALANPSGEPSDDRVPNEILEEFGFRFWRRKSARKSSYSADKQKSSNLPMWLSLILGAAGILVTILISI